MFLLHSHPFFFSRFFVFKDKVQLRKWKNYWSHLLSDSVLIHLITKHSKNIYY